MSSKKKTDIFVDESIDVDGSLNLELDLDLGLGDDISETLNTELGLDIDTDEGTDSAVDLNLDGDLRLDLQEFDLDSELEDVQSLNIHTDLERFTNILKRLSEYEGTSALINTRSTLKKFSDQFIKIVKEAVEEVNFELSQKQTTAIKNATKELKVYLDDTSKNDELEILPLSTVLDNVGFPVELLAICDKTLEWSLDKHINSTIMEMKEVQKQYLRSAQLVNPQLSETALKEGMHLHDVEKLEYNIANGEQVVHCPVCGKITNFKLLRFKKSYQELGPRPKYLYEVQPLLCSCGELIVLSDDSMANLDKMLSNAYQEEYVNSESDKTDTTNLFLPSAKYLRNIPEISINNVDDSDLIEDSQVGNSIDMIKNLYRNYSKSFIRKDLATIFSKTNEVTETIRLKLLIDNGFNKTEFVGYSIDEIVLGTCSQIPIVLELLKVKKRLNQINKQTLQVTKVMKIMEFLLSKETHNKSLEKYASIKFVNDTLSNLLSVDIQLSDKDYENDALVRSFYNKLLDLISELTISRADLESALKHGKLELFKHPLRYFIPVRIFANKSNKIYDILNIFEDDYEVKSFLSLATTYISINCWYHFLVDTYTGRFVRSAKPYKKYETKTTLKTTMSTLPIRSASFDLDKVEDLFNTSLDTFKLCINELSKLNSKYRFIYRLITLTKTSTDTATMTSILAGMQEGLSRQYLDRYNELDIDKFETYFILLELGFKSEEIIEMFTLGLNKEIDCRNLAIPRNNMTLKEYVENYNELNKFSGSRITLKQEDYSILFQLRMLESWIEDGKRDMHTLIKKHLLEYTVCEVLQGVDLFNTCDTIKVEKIDIESEFDIDFCRFYLNKGKEIVKIFMDNIQPVDQDLSGIYEENNDSGIIKLIANSGGELTEMDVIKRSLDENDISMFNSNAVNSYLIYITSHAIIDTYSLHEILPLIPKDKQEMFISYYCLFAKETYKDEWVCSNINMSYSDVLDLYFESFKKFMYELKAEIGTAYEKVRRSIKEVLGDELLNRI